MGSGSCRSSLSKRKDELMEPITLARHKREQLLEMCRALFPDNNFYFGIWNGFHHYVVESGMILIVMDKKNTIQTSFHWYEFCLNQLADKIIESFQKHSFTPESWAHHVVMQQLCARAHPVDVLYRIWKHPDTYTESL